MARIGITSALLCNETLPSNTGAAKYCAIFSGLGAIPILLYKNQDPATVLKGESLDGLIFTGGGDVAPGSYGGDPLLGCDVDLRRDIFESALMERAFDIGIPILAVCRGMQLVNVFLGGTLMGDLSHGDRADRQVHDQVNEGNLPFDAYAHDIHIANGSTLRTIASRDDISVNSLHHQAVDQLGRKLCVVARSDDGIVEAIEMEPASARFFLGVQWHPEWIPEDPTSQGIFLTFLQACEAFSYDVVR